VGAVGEEKNEQRIKVMINRVIVLKQIPGKKDSLTDVLKSMDRLASTFRAKDRLEDAESLRRCAFVFRSRTLS
jgi:hypothetical protein